MTLKQFNPIRVYLLLKLDVRASVKPMLFTVVILGLWDWIFHMGLRDGFYVIVFFALGAAITARAFQACHDKAKAYRYLTLPVANSERFLAKWLLTGPLYASGYWLCITVFKLVFAVPMDVSLMVNVSLSYLAFHSVILLGSLVFPTYPLLKTLLVMVFINAALMYFGFNLLKLGMQQAPNWMQHLDGHLDTLYTGLYYLGWFGIPIVCLSLAYWRLSKMEMH